MYMTERVFPLLSLLYSEELNRFSQCSILVCSQTSVLGLTPNTVINKVVVFNPWRFSSAALDKVLLSAHFYLGCVLFFYSMTCIYSFISFTFLVLQTFHTPSLGDEEFEIPPITPPPETESGLDLSEVDSPFPAMPEPPVPHRGALIPQFPPQSLDLPSITISRNMLDQDGMPINNGQPVVRASCFWAEKYYLRWFDGFHQSLTALSVWVVSSCQARCGCKPGLSTSLWLITCSHIPKVFTSTLLIPVNIVPLYFQLVFNESFHFLLPGWETDSVCQLKMKNHHQIYSYFQFI